MTAEEIAATYDAAAAQLLTAAADVQHEALYLRTQYPDASWSEETAQSYLDASRASRLVNVKRATREALRALLDDRDGLLGEATS